MEGNDIGVSFIARYAVKFEDLLMYEVEPPERTGVKKLLAKVSSTPKMEKATKYWRVHDMAMKQLLHLIHQLKINVEVITYMGEEYEEIIELWLARKGASVEVVSYDDPYEWAEDLRRDKEVQRYYTADVAERDIIGWQHVTVVRPSQPWG